MMELAFLRAFLVWESFLEESFLLYLQGRKPPRGRRPHRYVLPPDRRSAEEFVKEGRPYAAWHEGAVVSRASRYFRNGGYIADPLRANQAVLGNARTIRNAIAHESSNARQKFEELVREKLGTVPPNTSVATFLNTPIPGISPPISFLDYYLDQILVVADQIIPT